MQLALAASAADVTRNLERVLTEPTLLSERQRWGVALTAAYASRSAALVAAVLGDIQDTALIEDAKIAAILMAQNNVFFRFRHMVDKSSYQNHHSRLTMRMRSEVANELDFELFALAASTINACETCIRHHEQNAVDLGMRTEQINDAVRIAAVMHAAAVALEVG